MRHAGKGPAALAVAAMLAATAVGCVGRSCSGLAPDDPLFERTHVVLLGTGTPNPDPDRQGPALAVIAGGMPYLVDAGTGVVRRAAAAYQGGALALEPWALNVLFLTHLHSDHTLGLPDLILTPWVLGREEPLRVFGPPGTQVMVSSIVRAYEADVAVRVDGSQPSNDTGHRVEVTEVEPGVVFENGQLTVTAFSTRHGAWDAALGYRFHTDDGDVCVSGDTAVYPEMKRVYAGCDVLVHEVYSTEGFARRTEDWQAYHASSHTSSEELGRIAHEVGPGLLVLTHQLLLGASSAVLVEEVRREFGGRVVYGEDLLLVGFEGEGDELAPVARNLQ